CASLTGTRGDYFDYW
nr:immunoglobulin heavy chain junction region [Mus musculus]